VIDYEDEDDDELIFVSDFLYIYVFLVAELIPFLLLLLYIAAMFDFL